MKSDDDGYFVTLYKTPMPWPLSFAIHMWFVIEKNGIKNRVEVWAPLWTVDSETNVIVDALPYTQGFRSSYLDSPIQPKRVSVVIKFGEYYGGTTSVAKKLYDVIQGATTTYPYSKKYRLWPGPNSNTFIQWVSKQVPEAKIQIPWNAFGKHYAIEAMME